MNTLDAVVKFMALDSLLCWNLQLHVRAEKHDSEFQPSNLLYCFQGGKFDIIQLIVYIGSTLSYFGLVRDSFPHTL